ncbi:MAG TPA: glycosyl hydrolase, partial [Phnomibacter sp.]|nr:glycosyl hydrolase [Phnomibacter sp.]
MRKIATKYGAALRLFLFFTVFHITANGQLESDCDERSTYYYWVGGASNDFFDELNWREANRKIDPPTPGTDGGPGWRPGLQPKFVLCRRNFDPDKDKTPRAGTIDPGKPLPFNLLIENANVTINGPLVFSCTDKGLTLDAGQLQVNGDFRGTLHLEHSSTARVNGPGFPNGLRVSLTDHNSWVYFMNVNPVVLTGLPLSTWMIDLQVPGSVSALLINQYYQKGAVVRPDPSNYSPLTIYASQGYNGASAKVGIKTIHGGAAIAGGMTDNIRSFKLKRGFMATLAVNSNGTGKSKVYIASEEDLEISDLPASLSGNVSFIRVLPWNWVSKKGTGGLFAPNALDAGWFYTWSATNNTQINHEYVPMTWGAGATSPTGMQDIIAKENVTHLLGFNES